MNIVHKYLKDLYDRSLFVGFEYAEIEGFKYIFDGEYCILKDISLDIINNNSTVFIPDYFNKVSLKIQNKDVIGSSKVLVFGKRVKYIKSECFKNASWIYKIVAPGVKKLGNNCFSYSSIHILEAPNLIEIGADCFGHSSIASITSSKLKKIGKDCFSHCKNLQFIDTKNVIKLESKAFQNCVNLKYLNLSSLNLFRLNSIYKCNLDKLELNSVKYIIGSYDVKVLAII